MKPFRGSDISKEGDRDSRPMVRVHVLSEHIFCPRAVILALETGDDVGEDDRPLGPRLDGFEDYDEHRFAEELHAAYTQFCRWLMFLAPSILLVLVVWRFASPVWGAIASLPLFYCVARLWDTGRWIVALVRERALLNAASPLEIAMPPQQVQEVNWWSLRKAGFDCHKPQDSYPDLTERLVGRPWRVLTKGTTLRIPVIRKHRGDPIWRPQHVVRVAAYCRLIEAHELGDSPFGVLMFAHTYQCVIIPNDNVAKFQFENAFEEAREFMAVYEAGKYIPPEPKDNRCSGCHWGEPREYVEGESDTILKGNRVKPLRTKANNKRFFHCPCGDRFGGVPQHDDAIALGLVERRN
jgi:hypothetical protein